MKLVQYFFTDMWFFGRINYSLMNSWYWQFGGTQKTPIYNNNKSPILANIYVLEPKKDCAGKSNPESLRVIENAALEESLMHVSPGDRFQFERSGYFVVDKNSVQTEKLIFNRIVTLRDSWAKIKNISVSKK